MSRKKTVSGEEALAPTEQIIELFMFKLSKPMLEFPKCTKMQLLIKMCRLLRPCIHVSVNQARQSVLTVNVSWLVWWFS